MPQPCPCIHKLLPALAEPLVRIQALKGLATCQEKTGHEAQARQSLQAAIDLIDTDEPELQWRLENQLAILDLKQGKVDSALGPHPACY